MRVAGLIVIAVLGFVAQASAGPAALVQLATAQWRSIRPTTSAYGTVAPDPGALVTIALPRDGVIAAVPVRAGQSVGTGEAIATVQTAANASAAFAQAQSALAFAEKDLARTRELYAQQLATAAQRAGAEKAVSDARAVLQAQSSIGAGKTTEVLRAKTSGVVTAVNVSPGDRVQANAVIASIATRDRFVINLGLEPAAAQEVSPGDAVSLRAPQHPDVAFDGRIESVDAMMEPKSRLVNAIVSIPDNISRRLVLGTVLDATVSLAAKTGVVVPRSALLSDGGGNYAFVVRQGVARRRPVRVLCESGGDALLKAGVTSGEAVVVAGNAGIEDGFHVRVH